METSGGAGQLRRFRADAFELGFGPVSKAWYVAADTRAYYFLWRWEWYEWLGVFAPLAFLWWFRRLGIRDRNPVLAHLATRLAVYGVFQLGVAIVLLAPPNLARLESFQPMRFLHLLYLLFVLLAGGLLGRNCSARPAALGGSGAAARRGDVLGAASDLFRLRSSRVSRYRPFQPVVASLRLDSREHARHQLLRHRPDYMERPGEDFHSFRALAERSSLADVTKDASVVTQVPRLAPLWLEQVQAQSGWEHFGARDFQRLHARFGVDWLVLEQPGVLGLDCPYQNDSLRVCRVGGSK